MKVTKLIIAAIVLGGIGILLEIFGLGFVPVPTEAGAVEIVQLPTVLGAVFGGPLLGAIVGLIYGCYSYIQSTNPFFIDPVIAIVPSIVTGLVAYWCYNQFVGARKLFGYLAAAIGGILISKIFLYGIAVLKGYIPYKAALAMLLTYGVPEIVVMAVATGILGLIVQRMQKGSITYTRVRKAKG
jgi:uncharacterized membrane protein